MVFALRYPAKTRPVKPISIMAHVEGSGVAVAIENASSVMNSTLCDAEPGNVTFNVKGRANPHTPAPFG